MKLTKEFYDVVGWEIEVRYNDKSIRLKFDGGDAFFLDYYKDRKNCELYQFADFLHMVRSNFLDLEEPERKVREVQK